MNYKHLKQVCRSDFNWFKKFGDVVTNGKQRYIFQDNGANVLAVAHLDTVLPYRSFDVGRSKGKVVIRTQTLDDRLGAYLALYYLKGTGVKYDILLTEDEEICNSSATHFKAPRNYNWMFQFDRSGTDVVMYNYENDETTKAVTDAGFKVGIGSYTDICDLGHLGIGGFNFGTGYYNNHSPSSYAILNETVANAQRFAKLFYPQNKDVKFEYDEEEDNYYYSGRYSHSSLWNYSRYPNSTYGHYGHYYNGKYEAKYDGDFQYGLDACDICSEPASDLMYGVALCAKCMRGMEQREKNRPVDYFDADWWPEKKECDNCGDYVPEGEEVYDYILNGTVYRLCESCFDYLATNGANNHDEFEDEEIEELVKRGKRKNAKQ